MKNPNVSWAEWLKNRANKKKRLINAVLQLSIWRNVWIGIKKRKKVHWKVTHRLPNATLQRYSFTHDKRFFFFGIFIGDCFSFQAKHLLDYLLSETHFDESDITSYPRVFMNSVETLKGRLNELSTVGYVPKRLYIICLDQKRYLEVIEKHCKRLNDENIWRHFRIIEKRIKEKWKLSALNHSYQELFNCSLMLDKPNCLKPRKYPSISWGVFIKKMKTAQFIELFHHCHSLIILD